MTSSSWRLSAAIAAAGLMMAVIATAPDAFSKPKGDAKPKPTVAPTLTPAPTPTPKTLTWNFDQDKADGPAAEWTPVIGSWAVKADPTAPSQPNAFGIPGGGLIPSLTHLLEYYPAAVLTDPTEYTDFTLEGRFKAPAAYHFDCSGGLIFRYVNASNYYVIAAGCPSDYFALGRMTDGKFVTLKQAGFNTDTGVWYKLKVVVEGHHFTCFDNDKQIFDIEDNKLAAGRIGVWARDDSQASFDNITLTLPMAATTSTLPAPPPSLPSLPPLPN
ncbi:MAG TPA: family 16 glycoside hydrolase [Candidatus Binataceae bacterium]|nr:family 16 glycoside hydrolase [Candidatus Binataceae bacterium]